MQDLGAALNARRKAAAHIRDCDAIAVFVPSAPVSCDDQCTLLRPWDCATSQVNFPGFAMLGTE